MLISYRTNMFGNAVLEKEHLEEVEQYIKSLEAKNKELSEFNDSLEEKVDKLEQEVDEQTHESHDLHVQYEELKEEQGYLLDNMPNAKQLLELKAFQEKVNVKGGFSENYNIDDGELESILELGSGTVEEFVKNEKVTVPLDEFENAVLEFEGHSYEGSGSDAINIYTDYELVVNVYDNQENLKKSYAVEDFVNEYKNNTLPSRENVNSKEQTEKEKEFQDLLMEEILKDEYGYCFDRSYMSDEAWKEHNGNVSREQAFRNVVTDITNKSVVELLEERGNQYDYVYGMLRDEEDIILANKKVIFRDMQSNEFSFGTTVEGMFETLKEDYLHQSDFNEKEVLLEEHKMNLYTVDEKRHFIESVYDYEVNEPTLELVEEWERYTDQEFYKDVKHVTEKEAIEIIEDREPYGLFYRTSNVNDGVVVGIDNSTGDAWTEEFKSFGACMDWLNGSLEAEYYKEIHGEFDLDVQNEKENVWDRDGYTVELDDFDYDLKNFNVIQNDEVVATIYPNSIEDMNNIIVDLDNGEDVHGWENGMGDTISIPEHSSKQGNEKVIKKRDELER